MVTCCLTGASESWAWVPDSLTGDPGCLSGVPRRLTGFPVTLIGVPGSLACVPSKLIGVSDSLSGLTGNLTKASGNPAVGPVSLTGVLENCSKVNVCSNCVCTVGSDKITCFLAGDCLAEVPDIFIGVSVSLAVGPDNWTGVTDCLTWMLGNLSDTFGSPTGVPGSASGVPDSLTLVLDKCFVSTDVSGKLSCCFTLAAGN